MAASSAGTDYRPHERSSVSKWRIQPPDWPEPRGYANGILSDDGSLWIAGQIGWNMDRVIVADDLVSQAAQALANIRSIVETAGGTVEHVVRLTWFITDRDDYMARQKELGNVYRDQFGYHFPAMSLLIVSQLLEAGARVEIEATAKIPPDLMRVPA